MMQVLLSSLICTMSRSLLFFPLGVFLLFSAFVLHTNGLHAEGKLPHIDDLQAMAVQASERQVPVLLMVSQEHCGFCRTLREEILQPMQISGDYTDKVVMGEIMMDPGESLKDFAGRSAAAAEFAGDHKVWVTPTLLFFDPQGQELRPRMLGVNTVEMYSYYLDEALADALARLRSGEPNSYRPSEKDIYP